MTRQKYTDEEKQQIINEAKESGNICATAKKYSITDSTVHGWMKKKLKTNTKPTKDFSQEIRSLKLQLADAKLENSILKDLVKKTVQVWTQEDQQLMNTSPSNIQKRKY